MPVDLNVQRARLAQEIEALIQQVRGPDDLAWLSEEIEDLIERIREELAEEPEPEPDVAPVEPQEPDPEDADLVREVLHPPASVVFERTGEIATVTWDVPLTGPGLITGYRVDRDGYDANGTGPWGRVLPPNQYAFTFYKLVPTETYELSVAAVYGDLGQSEPITVAMPGAEAPKPPAPEPKPPIVVPDRKLILASSGTAQLNFGSNAGSLTSALQRLFGVRPTWISNPQHLSIVNGNEIRQRYLPNGASIGRPPSDVVQFALGLGSYDDLYCGLDVEWEDDFQWVQGGKMPGFAGGTRPTGGSKDPNGYSARFMFEDNGRIVAYVYYSGDTGTYGDAMELSGVRMRPGGKYRVAQRVAVGSRSTKGVIQAWFDGERKLSRNVPFITSRTTKPFKTDILMYSGFFGGNRPSNAPPRGGCHARYSNFKVGHSLEDVL